MNLSQLTSADLKNIVELVERKEVLIATLASIDAELTKFESGGPALPALGKPGRKPARPAKASRAARGSVKAAIIQLVKGAGATGITVKDIAARLGVKYNGVFTWFYNTGKRIKEIKKIGPGSYAWVGTATSAPTPAPVKAPATPAKPAAAAAKPEKASAKPEKSGGKKTKGKVSGSKKAKSSQRGDLKESIVSLVTASGKAGILARAVAAKLSAPPARIYNWFQTTGKKVKQIKKIGRGKYAWVG